MFTCIWLSNVNICTCMCMFLETLQHHRSFSSGLTSKPLSLAQVDLGLTKAQSIALAPVVSTTTTITAAAATTASLPTVSQIQKEGASWTWLRPISRFVPSQRTTRWPLATLIMARDTTHAPLEAASMTAMATGGNINGGIPTPQDAASAVVYWVVYHYFSSLLLLLPLLPPLPPFPPPLPPPSTLQY